MDFKNGQVLSFQVKSSTTIPGWTPPVCFGVVIAEQGSAYGPAPEESIGIAPVFESDPDEPLRINHVRVPWNPNRPNKTVNFIDVDCALSTTIPRSWIIEDQGTVSASSLKQIDDGVNLYW